MSNPVNPKTLTVNYNGKDEDGNALNLDGLTFRGFVVEVDGTEFLVLPASLNAQGVYVAQIEDEVRALPNKAGYQLRARTYTTVDGTNPPEARYSEYSVTVPFDVTIVRKPARPFGVALS